jgi:hypothetical protein
MSSRLIRFARNRTIKGDDCQGRREGMPNWCRNNIVVTGPVEEIARFTQTCIRLDKNEEPSFDFNSVIPMPAIIKDRIITLDDLLILNCDDPARMPRSLEVRMKYWKVPDIEALKEKIRLEAFENAGQSIEAFEQTGASNSCDWANMNWGTKWNASDFKAIKDEPGRYDCRFETAWNPPEPVYVRLADMFPNLCFEINGWDDQLNFDFQATIRGGAFNIQYDDPHREGFWMGMDSDSLLNHAKAYGNDPKRFLCVGLCGAVTSGHCNGENEDPEGTKAVVAWARGDTKEKSENSCREVIARNRSCIETLATGWQFTVYAPGEIHFQENAPSEPRDLLPVTDDDVPF